MVVVYISGIGTFDRSIFTGWYYRAFIYLFILGNMTKLSQGIMSSKHKFTMPGPGF